MPDFPAERLGGEADPNSWHFNRVGDEGPLPNPHGHTFPLISHDSEGRCRIIGTGFYVNNSGMFVTARHVIEEVIRDGVQIAPLVALHLYSATGLFGPSECFFRPIAQCWLGGSADVALGYAAPQMNALGERLPNWSWTLSWRVPSVGTSAVTYAFPRSAVSDNGKRVRLAASAYMGRVQASGDFRDSIMMPFPYLQVDCRIHGGASGGPMLAGSGVTNVVGINCTEYVEGDEHSAGPAFVAQTQCLSDAFLEDFVLPGEAQPRLVTFDEMVEARVVNVAEYVRIGPNRPRDGRIILPHMPYAAPRPSVDVEVYV